MALFGKKKYTLVKVKKKDIPAGLWSKCPECDAPTYKKELLANLNVCPKCEYHFPLTAQQRINLFIDKGTFEEHDSNLKSVDPLKFKGPKTYKEKIYTSTPSSSEHQKRPSRDNFSRLTRRHSTDEISSFSNLMYNTYAR